MDDDAFISSSLLASGIIANKDSIQLVKNIAVHGKTGMKDREITALAAQLTEVAAKYTIKASGADLSKVTNVAATFAVKVSKSVGSALDGAGAVLGVVTAIFQLVSDLQDREETNEIAKRHLQGLDTAKGLAPESIRIVAAIRQMVAQGFDEHELRSSDAEMNVTIDFLTNKIRPLAQNIDEMDDQTISNYLKRLVARVDIHRKDTHVDLQRVRQGVANMAGDYQINTNHLVRYASASLLDAYLSYYELLLSYRLGDGLVQHNLATFSQRNKDAIVNIEQGLAAYTNGRMEMIRTHAFYE